MKRLLGLVVLCGSAGLAGADSQSNPADTPDNPLATPAARPQATYVVTNPALGLDQGPIGVGAVPPTFSNIIYLNNCLPTGCQVTPGNVDSTRNISGIPSQPSTVQPWAYSQDVWQQVVTCVQQVYSPFGVQIVDQRPAAPTNYHMAIVAGRPQDVQMQSGVGGVSEFTCGYIPNAISYSFANIYGPDVDEICWTIAQETAHAWGLDHKFDNRDPMTYLESGPSRKTFQNESGPCGEFSARSCQCGGSQMNSFQEVFATFGGSTPTPPSVSIDSPKDGETVAAGFQIRATITDDVAVAKAALFIDGKQVSVLTGSPFVWTAGANVGQGLHTIKVSGFDIGLTETDAAIRVTLGHACKNNGDCDDDTAACVDGRCVPGSGVDGGLGTTCTSNPECKSGSCAGDADGNHFCVEACDPTAAGCPSGFDCIDTGNGNGACWPSAGGGCLSASGGTGSMMMLLALAGLLIMRRKR